MTDSTDKTTAAGKPARSHRKAAPAAPAAPAPTDPAAETRKCSGACGQEKPLRSFPALGRVVDGVMQRGGECRTCRNARLAAKKEAT